MPVVIQEDPREGVVVGLLVDENGAVQGEFARGTAEEVRAATADYDGDIRDDTKTVKKGGQ